MNVGSIYLPWIVSGGGSRWPLRGEWFEILSVRKITPPLNAGAYQSWRSAPGGAKLGFGMSAASWGPEINSGLGKSEPGWRRGPLKNKAIPTRTLSGCRCLLCSDCALHSICSMGGSERGFRGAQQSCQTQSNQHFRRVKLASSRIWYNLTNLSRLIYLYMLLINDAAI